MENDKHFDHTQGNREHHLTLSDRKRLTLSGVTEVLRFEDTVALFDTTDGRLTIRGENLRVESMDVEAGNVILKGVVCALGYAGDSDRKNGIFGKLFR